MTHTKTILVVEDHRDTRELMVHILRRAGFAIAEAETGLDAVERAQALLPDLILMDLGLPGITGDEVTARLKADCTTRNIPIVVNTAFHKESKLVERAIAVGAAEILHKPISFAGLPAIVGRYLDPDHTELIR